MTRHAIAGRGTRSAGGPPGLRVDILLAKGYDPDPRVQRTATALADAGYRPRVLAWDRTGNRPRQSQDGPVPIRRIRVRSRQSRGWTQVFFLFRVAREYLRLMREDPPDILHAVDLPMLAVAIGLAPFVGPRRPPIVYDAFEIAALMGVHRYPRWLVRVIGILERYLPRLADVVITPGEERRDYFGRLGIESIAVPNWVDPPASPPSQAEARRRLEIPEDRFTIVYAGGILGSRDLEPLIEHARRYPEDIVLIAGGGDAVPRLRRDAQGLRNVRFLGWVPDTTEVLAAGDALYYALKPEHPYAAHAAPNNLYVAVAHAIPLVHRAQGELDLVGRRHDIGAVFYDGATLDAAIDSLREPARNATVRRELRAMQTTYRWSAAARRLLGAYPMRPPAPRILLLTRIWPTRARPSVGSFVRARAEGVSGIAVVRPRRDRLSRPLLYGLLLWDGLTRRGRFDGVEAHVLVPTGFVGLIVARLRRVPLVVYAHGSDARDIRRHSWPIRVLSRLVVRNAQCVVTNSNDTAGHVRQLGREAMVIPPGVDLSRFRPTPRPEARRVLYLGGRLNQKGFEVARELADTLVGPSIREVDPDDVAPLIAEHDIVLVPSQAEAFGLVAVEAIASGRWVVANAVGGLRDIVIDGVNGTLVSDGDFAGALARVPEYDPFDIAATVRSFSLDRWQSAMTSLWEGVLADRQAA
jgi:D-inositol-3-phosphate glycosyltransferase